MGLDLVVEEPAKGVFVLCVGGEVDLNSSPELRAAMSPHLKKKKKALIVDLSGVSYMDSSGIATLVEAMKIAQKTIQ
jgi:anti-sigma B factor antagonist